MVAVDEALASSVWEEQAVNAKTTRPKIRSTHRCRPKIRIGRLYPGNILVPRLPLCYTRAQA